MNLKKLSIIFSIILIVFSSTINISFAINDLNLISINTLDSDPTANEYIKDLEVIDNYMYLLIKSIISEGFDKNQVNKDIKYIETLINDLTIKSSKLSEKDNNALLAMQSILNFYKMSLTDIKKYINSKNADDLIKAITSFSLGYNSSSSLRKIIGEARV